jgi:Na+/melibiose symporter-like transporter
VAVVGILIISSVIIAIDVPPLVRKKRKKELWIFSTLLLFGTALSIALVSGVQIPNPMDFITWIFKPFSELIGRIG